MQVKPRSYPHPVLSHFGDDIVGSIFQPVVKVEVTKNAYQLSAVFKTNNDDLIELVKSKKAFYAVHVECLQTRYREIFTTATDTLVFEVPSGQIEGRVEVCSFILAAQPIKSYRNSGFHDDYAKLSFTVRKGDTLAVGQDREFTAEKKAIRCARFLPFSPSYPATIRRRPAWTLMPAARKSSSGSRGRTSMPTPRSGSHSPFIPCSRQRSSYLPS
jgi:hypothetical protein